MPKKLISAVFVGLITLTVFEVFFYFVYIFKPFDRLKGRDLLTPQGLPTASDLLASLDSGGYLNVSDGLKTFYANRLTDFEKNFSPIVSDDSSFVKTAEADYVLAGYVDSFRLLNDPSAFEITLTNTTGKKYTFLIKDDEAQYAHVFAVTPSGNGFSRTEKTVADVVKGDYLTIKRSFNLLNPEEVNIEIEMLSIGK